MNCKNCLRDEFVVAWTDPTVASIRCISCGKFTHVEKHMSIYQDYKYSIEQVHKVGASYEES